MGETSFVVESVVAGLLASVACGLGVLPLLIASGAGAEARKVMGMTVFGGMLVATVIGVLVIPALFVIVERYVARNDAPSTETPVAKA